MADRRQEIVFIGEKPGLQAELDSCLLNKQEMKKWERIMRSRRSADAVQDKLDETSEGKHRDLSVSALEVSEGRRC